MISPTRRYSSVAAGLRLQIVSNIGFNTYFSNTVASIKPKQPKAVHMDFGEGNLTPQVNLNNT